MWGQNLTCTAVACNAAWLSWTRPERLGHPPLHKYKLERWRRLPGSGEAGKWETAHGDLDGDELSWQDEAVEVLPCPAGCSEIMTALHVALGVDALPSSCCMLRHCLQACCRRSCAGLKGCQHTHFVPYGLHKQPPRAQARKRV